jgi:hypothetical protein
MAIVAHFDACYDAGMRPLILAILIASSLPVVPAAAQNREPKNYADCDALYDREMKTQAKETNKDLREAQRRAGLQRLRCERAVERKIIQSRAKTKR